MVKFLLINIIFKKLRNFKHNNYTSLHLAAQKNSKEIGEILILNGADMNAVDINHKDILIKL